MIEYIWYKLLKKVQGKAIKNSCIHKSSKIEAGSVFIGSNMDRNSFCGYNCKILNADIGPFCSIADSVIIGGAEHPIYWVSTSPAFYSGRDSIKKKYSQFHRGNTPKTIIGADVWIGDRAIIKAGVRIGNGAVIGMGAVVTHDVNPYEIVAGIPAKVIKKRFDENTIEQLQMSKWWELDDDRLAQIAKYIREPKDFIEEIQR